MRTAQNTSKVLGRFCAATALLIGLLVGIGAMNLDGLTYSARLKASARDAACWLSNGSAAPLYFPASCTVTSDDSQHPLSPSVLSASNAAMVMPLMLRSS